MRNQTHYTSRSTTSALPLLSSTALPFYKHISKYFSNNCYYNAPRKNCSCDQVTTIILSTVKVGWCFCRVDSRRPLTLCLAARVRVPAYHIHSTFFFTSSIQLLYCSSTRLAYGEHVKSYSSNVLSTIFSTSLGNPVKQQLLKLLALTAQIGY